MSFRKGLLILLLMMSPAAWAQDQDVPKESLPLTPLYETFNIKASVQDTVVPLDLTTLSQRVLENNLDVQISNSKEIVAKSLKTEAMGQFLPNLIGGIQQNYFKGGVQVFNGTPNNANITTIQPELQANWTISTAGREFYALSAMKKHLKEATWDKKQVTLNALESTTKSYFEYVQAFQSQELAEKGIEEAKAIVDMQNERFKQGVGTQLEVLDAELQLENRNAEMLTTEKSILKAGYDLVSELRYPMDTQFVPAQTALEPLNWFNALPQPEELVKKGMKERPDILEAQVAIEATQAEFKAQWASAFPTLKVSSYINGIGNSYDGLMFSRFAGLELTTDLLNHLGVEHYQRLKQAHEKTVQAQLALEKLKMETQNAISESYLDCKVSKEQMALRQKALKVAQAAYDQAVGRLQFGLGNQLEVTSAMRSLADARNNWTQSILAYDIAQVHLAKELGNLDQYLLSTATVASLPPVKTANNDLIATWHKALAQSQAQDATPVVQSLVKPVAYTTSTTSR